MIRGLCLALGPVLAAGAAWGDVSVVEYTCDRGAVLSVAYVTGGEDDLAIMPVEGQLVALERAQSGSGVLYSQVGREDGYIWFAKGDEALLGHGGVEGTTILPGCRAAE
ncbi:MliC family protein [Oceaniglobus trochenteri]|uniref:MliC family protein n=1 Tax=Oceaniglobus trochenteri TaxID=2763260 RepID=UPI001CFF980D|nr:MliC family protein [Oceaniglobus trochenteri]